MKKSLTVHLVKLLSSILPFRRGFARMTLLLYMLGLSQLAFSQSIPAPDSIDPYLNGIFPDQTPGPSGSWEVVNAFPNLTFVDPVQILEVPGTTDLLVAGKSGRLWTIENDSNTSVKTIFLDIGSQIFIADDCGLLGVAFHPEFGQVGSPNRGYFYVYYRYTNGQVDGEKAYNRLSRFTLADSATTVDPNTEYVLIQQYDRHRWHNGGGIFFAPDGFLYLSVGDEGSSNDFFNTTQAIDQWLFSGVLRIDVDKDSTRSHPIRRQPQNSAAPPAGWEGSYTQGYFIPNDNPWLDSAGAYLEEFYALGLRSPHRMTRDPQTGDIWVGDIGQSLIEEVSKISKGDNLQWPYKEGHGVGPKAQPDSLIGNDKDPVYSYNRTEGTSVIGGFVYRGTKFPSLFGKYIFGDHTFRSVWSLEEDLQGGEPTKQSLVTVPAEGIGTKNGISSFGTDSNGEVFILKLFGTDMDGGKVFKLQKTGITPDPPALLSQTGAFTDLASLTPSPGIFPYKPNAQLWSDRAVKDRWIAIPNDGVFDEASEKVSFDATGEWTFPSGTVFIKHFELPIDEANPSITQRIETRFFVITADGRGYGVSYKWNDQGTEATLLTDGDTKDFTVSQAGGGTYTQTWTYPNRQQCLTCHNEAAKYVLGAKTHQLNGDLYYPSGGSTANQLDTWNAWGIFDTDIGGHDQYLKSVYITDSTASLESRVRSYLDMNCAFCHRPNYVQGAFDARFITSLHNQNLINAQAISSSSTPGGVIVNPGDPSTSELWIRDASSGGNRMPPLAVSIVDTTYIQTLTDWINSLGNQDTIPPTVPTGVAVSDSTGNSFQIIWDSSTDNVGVSGYKVYVNMGTQVIVYEVPYSPFGNVFDLYDLEQGATYLVAISAIDEAGNESNQSASILASTRSCGIAISNIVLSPVSACGLADGSISIQAQGNSLEYSIDGGQTYSSNPLFENLEGGEYWVFVKEIGDTTHCTLSDQVIILEPEQCPTCDPLQNLALGQATSQSSTYGNGVSSVAVDGVQAGDSPWGNDPTLQHTEIENEPWWKLSLDTLYQLENVKLLNRSDCCQDRLRDFYVFVSQGDIDASQSLDSLIADSSLFSVYFAGAAGLEETLSLNHQDASTLLIKMTGTGRIHLAEVEVYGCPIPEPPPCEISFVSVANTPPSSCNATDGFISVQANGNNLLYSIDGGLTYQSSSTYDSLVSGYYDIWIREANQGGCELEYPNNPVMLINPSAVGISQISTTIQTDCVNPNGTLSISAFGNNLQYSIDGGNQYQSQSTFENLAGGTYIIHVRDSLDNMCIDVDTLQLDASSACDSLDCESNLALGKSVSQSSQYGDGVPEIAVDGNTSGSNVWGVNADLQHTQTESQPWWKVNLGSSSPLDSIRIFNRSNCCQSRLNNFYVLVSSIDFDANLELDTLLIDSTINAFHFPGSAGLTETIDLSQVNGQFVAIKLSDTSVQMHMAEVEVFGCDFASQCLASIDSIQATNPSNCGIADGEISVYASGDSLEYSIDGGQIYQDSPTFSGLSEGLFTIFIREIMDTTCIITDTIRIDPPLVPVISSVSATDPTDCGLNDGTLTIIATGDSLEYSIDGGLSYQDSNYFVGLSGGSYDISVREVQSPGCEVSDSTNLTSSVAPVISSINPTDPTDCGLSDGTLTIIATGDSLEYSIDGGLSYQDSNYFSGLSSGSYDISVREVQSPSCEVSDSTNLTSSVAPVISSINPTDPTDCGLSDGTLTIIATGDSLEYSIDGGLSYQDSNYFSGLSSGSYDISVREVQSPSCEVSDSTNLTSSVAPVISSINPTDPTDCGLSDGTLTIFATGDSLEYSIDGGLSYQDSSYFGGLNGGSYDISVREVQSPGCEVSANASLTSPVAPVITSISATDPTDCGLNDGTLTIFATGNSLEYSIDGGLSYQDSNYFGGLSDGNYDISVRKVASPGCGVIDTSILEDPICQPDSCTTPTNLALGKSTSQMGQYGDGSSDLAVDGDTTGTSPWGATADLQHASTGTEPWWKVDLGNESTLDNVKIFNRSNCCQSRMENFYVFISSQDIDASQSISTLLADSNIQSIHNTNTLGLTESIPLNQTQGRYIVLKLVGSSRTLHLSEVEVYGCIDNSVPPSCDVVLDSVNTTDLTLCGADNGSISIYASGSSLEYSIDGGVSYLPQSVFTNLAAGSYPISVRKSNLTSCEALDTVIIASPAGCDSQNVCTVVENLALGKSTSQMGQYGDGSSDLAVDGDTTGTSPWGATADLQHASTGTEPWWKVDLGNESTLDNVKIFNRSNCCQDRMENFYVFISSQDIDASQSISTLLADSNIQSIHNTNTLGLTESLPLNQTQGRYIVLKLVGSSRTLHLSEVEVYGCIDNSVPPSCDVVLDSVNTTDLTLCGADNGSISIYASGSSLEYSIDGGVSYLPQSVFSNLAAGSYPISVRKSNLTSCEALDTVVISSPAGCDSQNVCTVVENLALGKSTSQMGQYGDGSSDLAVDGDTTGTSPWGATADLQHASTGTEPWWKVDLGNESTLDNVKIFNRSNCCQDRMENFYVFISSQDIDASQSISTLLADSNIQSIHNTNTLGLTESIPLNQTQGRYIVLKLVGSSRTLHLSEVEVYGCIDNSVPPSCDVVLDSVNTTDLTLCGADNGSISIYASGSSLEYSIDGGVSYLPQSVFSNLAAGSYPISVRKSNLTSCEALDTVIIASPAGCDSQNVCTVVENLALGKSTSQMGQYGDGSSDLAVDGDTTGTSPWGATADLQHASPGTEPWWKVDLGNESTLDNVKIFNRSNCCQSRMENFYVFISSQDIDASQSISTLLADSNIQSIHNTNTLGLTESISLNQAKGRYIVLKLVGSSRTLHLSEVEVWGCTESNSQRFQNPNIDPVLSVSEELKVFVKPNPYQNFFELSTNYPSGERLDISIINGLGQVVWRGQGDSGQYFQIGHNLAVGVYWVHVQGNGRSASEQIIKIQ